MPSLLLPNGIKHRYRTIPLFPGVKQINKKIAGDNLRLLKKFLDINQINFQLAAGTLLGIIRENDFIDHDEDIDLAFLEKDRIKFLNLLPELRNIGFELCRFDRRDLYSLMRKGEYIDLYFFHQFDIPELSICSGWVVKTEYLMNSITIQFKGEFYQIPKDYEKYLIVEYGNDWKIPRIWNNYNQSKLKVWLFNMKEHIKDYLPNQLFILLAKKAEKSMIYKSLSHINRVENIGVKID